MNKIKKIIHLILDFYRTLLISCINKNKKFSYIYAQCLMTQMLSQ